MSSFTSAFIAGMGTAIGLHAAPVQIPYSSGKQSDYIQVRTLSFHPYIGTQSALTSVILELGDLVTLRFRWEQGQPPSGLCSMSPEEFGRIYLQITTGGEARQLRDSGTSWQSYPIHPLDSTLSGFDTLPIAGDSVAPIGYRFASVATCEGEHQFATGSWNRLIFVRKGSRYAKLSIVAKQDTAWGVLPSYGYLKTITFRYIVNDTNELSDPVSIRAPRTSRIAATPREWRTMDLYSPLGVKIRREPGRFEAVIPARR